MTAVLDGLPASLPQTHYLFSQRFGWFDRSHFDTGRPDQVIADVRAAVAGGDDVITIRQGVRGEIAGYEARYLISNHLAEADALAAALGIYMDWSLRFEAWQSEPPQGLAGPLTPFAVEDLPSQYLGFYADAHDLAIDQIFACYLGPVTGSEEGPPHFVPSRMAATGESWAGIARLQNKSFAPIVETETGWEMIDWPEPLQMAPLSTGPTSWQFVSDERWYPGDEVVEMLELRVFAQEATLLRHPNRR